MAKKGTAKFCIGLGVVLLLASGAILAWYFLAGNDSNSASSNNSSNNNNNNDGGLFGTGLFAGDKKNETATTSNTNGGNANTGPLLTIAPTATPSMAPSEYRYPFDQCTSSGSDSKCCNGLDNLCDWPANNILFAGVHNAMATQEKFLVPNHLGSGGVKEALEAGYRAVNIDICHCPGKGYELCHGFCGIGSANVVDTLQDVVTFLDTHPNDVVLMTMELNSDAGYPVDLVDFYYAVVTQVEGLTKYMYIHTESDDTASQANPSGNTMDTWPTLGSLIDNDTRLLAFHFNGPDCNQDGACPDGMHYYFRYFQETNWDFASIDALANTQESCPVTRGATTSTGAFYGVNDMVTLRDAAAVDLDLLVEKATTTNSYDFAKNRIQDCQQVLEAGTYFGDDDVNVIYVDFWSLGDIVQVVQEHNRDLGTFSSNNNPQTRRRLR